MQAWHGSRAVGLALALCVCRLIVHLHALCRFAALVDDGILIKLVRLLPLLSGYPNQLLCTGPAMPPV
jgi:hypothetical protein